MAAPDSALPIKSGNCKKSPETIIETPANGIDFPLISFVEQNLNTH